MKIRMLGVLSTIGLALSITPVWAGPVGVQRSLSPDEQDYVLSQLNWERQQVSRQQNTAPYNKGPLLIHNMDRAAQLDNLINRVRSGQPVSPDEIDQAVQPTLR